MEGQLFTAIAVLNPGKKDVDENGTLSEIVMQPTVVIAKTSESAAIKIVLGTEALKKLDQDRLEVVVVPFH